MSGYHGKHNFKREFLDDDDTTADYRMIIVSCRIYLINQPSYGVGVGVGGGAPNFTQCKRTNC